MANLRPGRSKPASREKARSPIAQTRELARDCCRNVKLDGTPEGRILALYQVGQYLDRPPLRSRRNSYGKDLLEVFVRAWPKDAALSLGLGTAKYARRLARSFDEALLKKALDCGVGWTSLTDLSRSGVSDELRQDIIAQVAAKELRPAEVVAAVNARVVKLPRLPGAKQAAAVLARTVRRLEALVSALPRLRVAIDALTPDDRERVAEDWHKAEMLAEEICRRGPQLSRRARALAIRTRQRRL